MNREEKDLREIYSDLEEQPEKKPVSALDAINASFNQKTMQAEADGKGREEKAETTRDARKSQRVWNIITGILITVILVVAVLIVLTLIRQNREGNQGSVQPPQSESVGVSGETQTDQETDDSEKPKQSEETGSEKKPDSEKETQKESETKKAQPEETETASTQKNTDESNTGETEDETKQENGELPAEYQTILSAEEQKAWKEKEKDSSKVFIQMNQKVEVSDPEKVYLRLINPPYSVYVIQLKIYLDEDPDNILYQSEQVEPGKILEYAKFNGGVSQGSHSATAQYIVYDNAGNEMGAHDVKISVEGQ